MSPRDCARLLLALCLVCLLATACSKSSTSEASSESSSNSSSSSSGSSSGPSGYVKDVRDYTQQFVLSGGDLSTFSSGIGSIAQKRGVTNWEQDEETFEGIGRGLKQSGVSGQRFEQLKQRFGETSPNASAWIQKGYDSEKKKD